MVVKPGTRINWAYHGRWSEKKTGIGTWEGTFTATKRRSARSYGGYHKGTTGKWWIQGVQIVTKTAMGEYQTKFYFTKRNLGFNVPKR